MNTDVKFSPQLIRAIIGLGNPGLKYYKNRHSIGFRVLDTLAQHLGCSWQSTELMEYISDGAVIGGNKIFLIKPKTFMNNSGKVISWLQKKGIRSDQILVVHDELEKKFGQLVLKFGGSHKGHNGLRSLMEVLGQQFWRLKVGIGRPSTADEVPDYVLADFNKQEEALISELIEQAIVLIQGA